MIDAPVARISPGLSAFTVALVPTGMNCGVSTTPCGSLSRPARARVEPPVGGATSTSNRATRPWNTGDGIAPVIGVDSCQASASVVSHSPGISGSARRGGGIS